MISRLLARLRAISMGVFFPVLILVAGCATDDIPLIAIQVDPLCASVASGDMQQFNAMVFVNDVLQPPDNSAVIWSVFDGDINGIISNDSGSEGKYTASDTIPPANVEVTIVATSKEDDRKAGEASVFINAPCPPAPPPSIEF